MGLFNNFLDKFGSPEATRELLKKNYSKYRQKALRRGDSPYDAHFDAVSRLLVGRCSSPLSSYSVNRNNLMCETYPFSQTGPDMSIPLIIEYILYLENDADFNHLNLYEGINKIIEDILDKENEVDRNTFSEHISILKDSINLDIPWTKFIDERNINSILNKNH